MDSEVFIENKCNKTWKSNDWGFYCHDCSLQELIVICTDCYDKTKHFGHQVETVVCEAGIECDCGCETTMRSEGFCAKHQVPHKFERNKNRSFKGSSKSSRKSSDHSQSRRGSEGFFDGIFHLFAAKQLDLPEFYELNKISKYTMDGIVITKYFDRSRAHYLEEEVKLKRVYEINKLSNRYTNPEFVNKKRLLLWYFIDNSKGNGALNKILNNGISYENGKMGRALYFRDRIKRFRKYGDKDFGLLLLCEVEVGNVYRVFEKKKYLREVPFGYDSLKCVGKYMPDPNKSKTIGTGIIVPTGKTVVNEDIENETDFDINQFIVFDKTQVIIRFLLQYNEHKK